MNQNSWLSAVTTCIYLSDGLIPFADGLTALSRSSGITTCIANNTFQVEDFNFSLYTMELFFSPQFFETFMYPYPAQAQYYHQSLEALLNKLI